MSNIVEVKVPDIGDFTDVPVIDVFVKAGDTVKVDDALVTLESDKATMDVPSSAAGVVKEVKVKLGDRISEGSVVILLETGAAAASAPAAPAPQAAAAAPAVARILAQRASVADLYRARLAEDPRFELPALAGPGERLSWFTWPLRLAPELAHRRDALIQALRAAGIGCNTYFTPVHQLPYHRGRHRQVALPVSDDIGRRCLAVPLHGQMGAAEVDRVCEALDRLLP